MSFYGGNSSSAPGYFSDGERHDAFADDLEPPMAGLDEDETQEELINPPPTPAFGQWPQPDMAPGVGTPVTTPGNQTGPVLQPWRDAPTNMTPPLAFSRGDYANPGSISEGDSPENSGSYEYTDDNTSHDSGDSAESGGGDDTRSTSTTSTWYNPARRRAGQGTRRRNEMMNRRIDLGGFPSGRGSDDSNSSSGSGSSSGSSGGGAIEFRALSSMDQLFAVLERSAKQLWGQKLLLALEILVPLLFVILTVILWAVFGTENVATMTYVDYTSSTLDAVAEDLPQSFLCFNERLTDDPIPVLRQCQPGSVLCDQGDYSRVPIPANSLCSESFNALDKLELLLWHLGRTLGYLAYVPQLDTLILYQWLAMIMSDEFSPLVTPSLTGLADNTRYSAIACSGKLMLAGPSTVLTNLSAYLHNKSELLRYIHSDAQNFATVEAARASVTGDDRLWMVVEVVAISKGEFDVVMHLNNSALPSFALTYDTAYPGGNQFDNSELYLNSGYLTMQKLIAEFYMSSFFGVDMAVTNLIASTSFPAFLRIPIMVQARQVLPLVLTLAYLYTVSQLARRIVAERETRLREAMLIMGLKQWTLYFADFLVQFFLLFVVAILSTIILKVTYVTKSDALVLFLMYLLYSLTTIPLAGLIASFFSKARLAALAAPVIFFILVVPMFAITNVRGVAVIGFSILSPSGFASALNIFLNHESGNGFTPRHFNSRNDDPALSIVLGMLAADFVIYYLLMLYFDAVLPREWGTPKHPLFFVIDPFRACCGGKAKRLEGGVDGRAENGVFEDEKYSDDVVQMDGLRKEYKRNRKTFTAVDNLYWGMREGEISVLLGHNGAGKTTVLNMMTGMTEPDQGDVYVYDLSVRTESDMVRREVGFCPQHNILWPELTCRDHLEFYGRIKGLKGWELEDAMCRMLHETGLLDKMDQPAGSLSGGMKRKLSISIAFVAESRLVFLDEPTAGLDVGARRQTWELLKRMASSRTIILTTHYMDEADLLGHRIGIMSQGRLKCSGSSMFLKSRLGVGYSIAVSMDPDYDPLQIDDLVLTTVTDSDILGHNGMELSYRLPATSGDDFPELLNSMEERGGELGIRGYSLAATTLEEVFLKVSEEDLEHRLDASEDDGIEVVWNCTMMDGVTGSQVTAMFTKRFWNSMRDRRMQCFQIVFPVLCILIAMLLNLIIFGDPRSLVLDYSMFTDLEAPPTVFTAQCHPLWRPGDADIPNATHKETHYTGADVLAQSMLDSWFAHEEVWLGAISCDDIGQSLQINADLAPYDLPQSLNRFNIMLYNTSSKHQAPINQQTYYEQFLRFISGSPTATMKWSAALFEKPNPIRAITYIFIGALIMIPFTFLPSNPVAWVVKERECGARHQQDIAGMRFLVYWGCNFLFDLAAYMVSMLLCIIIFACFNRREFIALDRIGGTFALLIVYGCTSTVGAYALSFLFNEHATAQIVVMAVSFVAGFLPLILVYVLATDPTKVKVSDGMRWGFRLIPSYCVGEGLTNLLMLDANIKVGQATSCWDMDQLGWGLVYLAAEFPIFIFLTLLIDHPAVGRCFGKRNYNRDGPPILPSEEDSDVEEERLAVYEASLLDDSTDMVRVMDLRKRYPNGTIAVKGITFSIFPGEVFGFLGTNGAGKTTTISMLCQLFLPSAGTATICGYDLVDESHEAFQCIGYCPQFDSTLDLLTVEEHLKMYAALRGVVHEEREDVLEALLRLCELTLYRHTVASRLSGGNRRKLSVAISLVGGPQVLFLDEPSAGMDPVARRGMWTAIQRASKHCSVVLTTHHLEEVEALADIVAIMVDGFLRCIGDKVHLKNKYGSGFELSLRVSAAEFKAPVEEFVMGSFEGAQLIEGDERRLVYQIPRGYTFGLIFETIQGCKGSLSITDYSVSQTSIEQIFLQISGEDL